VHSKLYRNLSDATGTLHQNGKGVCDRIQKAKLKERENVVVCTDKLMIMKRKDKKDICLMSHS
jgi:hypothetical protein